MTPIRIGQTLAVRGQNAVVIKLHPMGAVDVETGSGRRYRMSGFAVGADGMPHMFDRERSK